MKTIYATNQVHYYKIISKFKSITVLPLIRVEYTDHESITTNAYDLYEIGALQEITETEFELYRNNTIKYLNIL